MAKFEFRLQRVLDYREMQEGWAKDAYIEARAARLEAEAMVEAIDKRRRAAMGGDHRDLSERQALDIYLQRLNEDERTQRHVITILEEEEGKALIVWQGRKQDLEALVKLREHAFQEYELTKSRREQAELDEWAVTRRPA